MVVGSRYFTIMRLRFDTDDILSDLDEFVAWLLGWYDYDGDR